MAFIHHKRPWVIAGLKATPEHAYVNRRRFLGALGVGAIGLLVPAGCAHSEEMPAKSNLGPTSLPSARTAFYPAKRNEKYKLDRKLSDEAVAGKYNNFYEFGTAKTDPSRRSGKFNAVPWTVEVAGMVKQARVIDLDDLLKRMPIEERLYRHRCVEAWAMAVPWTGFPLKALIDFAEPRSSAKYVRFVSASKPDEMPGIGEQNWYP